MESKKVKEIKKRLQETIEYCSRELEKDLFEKSLTLINELESENEKLAKAGKRVTEINEELSKEHKKIEEQLKDRIAELEKEKTCVWEEWTDGDHSIWCCSNCKEDFCFLEGDVYENNYGYCPHCGAKITALKELKEDDIDETLKEFL